MIVEHVNTSAEGSAKKDIGSEARRKSKLLVIVLVAAIVAISVAPFSWLTEDLRLMLLVGLSMALGLLVRPLLQSDATRWSDVTGFAGSDRWMIVRTSGDISYLSNGLRARLDNEKRQIDRLEDLRHFLVNDQSRVAFDRLCSSVYTQMEDRVFLLFQNRNEQPIRYDVSLHLVSDDDNFLACYFDAVEQADIGEMTIDPVSLGQVSVNNLPVSFFAVDLEGRFLEANSYFSTILGFSPNELADGMTMADIVDGSIPPGFCNGHSGDNATFALSLMTRTGSVIRARLDRFVVTGSDTDEWRANVIVRPADELANVQTALKVAEERIDRFFKFAPVAMAILNAELNVAEANPIFMSLLPNDFDLSTQNVFDLFSPEDDGEVREQLQHIIDDKPWEDVPEVKVLAADGDRYVRVFASKLEEGTGGGGALLLQLIDTTEQRNLELQFAQSQKMQAVGQLAGGVAHDFNNLLTAIIGHCDLLLLRARPGDELFPDIMQVKQNANRAANLVRQLLAFSRQQTLRPKILSLTDVLAELTHLIRRLIGENIELSISHGRDLWPVMADQGQFEQVVINLAVNARDAMQTGGHLRIRTENVRRHAAQIRNELMPAGDYVLLEFSDDGKGIATVDLGRIFEPFFTTKSQSFGSVGGSGTGLGLSTVFGIIKQTGGFIFPESVVGAGTTFRIYLPRHFGGYEVTADTVFEATEVEKPAQDLTGKGTILLVEDEDAVRVFAARALKNKGYTVIEADSGEAALHELEQLGGNVDLIISDVVMPQMDGPTLIKKIRDKQPHLKVIFISGYAEDAFRKSMDPDAEFELLPKPFSLKQLAGKVKEVMAAS
jgi:two-component system cell cycle sensor histidine kinase/response regulator CckA